MESLPILAAEIRIENVPQGFELGYLLLSASTLLPADSGPFFDSSGAVFTVLEFFPLTFTFVNDAFCKSFGVTEDEVLGTTFHPTVDTSSARGASTSPAPDRRSWRRPPRAHSCAARGP